MIPSIHSSYNLKLLNAHIYSVTGRISATVGEDLSFKIFTWIVFADKYMSRLKSDSGSVHGEGSWFSSANDNGFISAVGSFGYQRLPKEQSPSLSNASDSSRVLDPRLEGSKKSIGSVSALEELVRLN